MLKRLAALFLCVSLVPVQLAAGDQQTRLDTFLSGLETLQADFTQRLLNQYGEELETSTGVLYLKRPGMFHWSYSDPYLQQLISDAETLWIYDEDLEQLTIRGVSGLLEDSPAAILGGDMDINAHYVVEQNEDENGEPWLELTPRDTESQYHGIRLTFAGDNLQQMILFDSLGRTTQIVLDNLVRNPELDEALFQFNIPEGIDVIDARE